jgi:hypothetical protein
VGPCSNHPHPWSAVQGCSVITICDMRTHQYTISASSPRSSVPAATVRPSIDTSQERSALCSPSYGTAGPSQVGFSVSAWNVFPAPPPLRWYGTQVSLHVLSIAVVPVRSSHTRTTPSLPEETITLLFVPATESTPRKDVVPSLCPSKECDVPRDVLSNKYIL